jgi:hypothetical protein
MLRSRKGTELDGSDVEVSPMSVEKKKGTRKPLAKYRASILISAVLLIAVRIYFNEGHRQPNWWIAFAFISFPVVLSLAVVVGYGNAQPHQRIIAFGAVGAVLGNQLPSFISVFIVFSGVTLFHLASRPDGQSKEDNQGRLKAALAAIFLTVVFLFDNFFVWVVAATYKPGIDGSPEPLQDNGQLIQKHILNQMLGLSKASVVHMRNILNVQWALAAALGVTFGVVDMQMVKGRTVWGLALRTILMLAALRAIRVISFLLTVLPSQNPNCYRHRFPPPPEDWFSWIEIGMRPQSHGGCNDLIVSGHATVLTTFCCFAASVAGHKLVSIALWSMLAIDFLMEVYEGFHYSVDMWLGALIGCMMWRILAPLEQIDSKVGASKKLKSLASAKLPEILAYSTPAVAAYIDIVFVPHNYQAYMTIGFLVYAVFHAIRKGFTHFLQMELFTLMFLALSIWL